MDRIACILPLFMDIAKVRKVGCKCVAIEKDSVMYVDGPNSVINSVVECDKACMFRISGLIERVISCNPFIIFVML